jgi:hypothetical protein
MKVQRKQETFKTLNQIGWGGRNLTTTFDTEHHHVRHHHGDEYH